MPVEIQAHTLGDRLTMHVRIVGWRGFAVRLALVRVLLRLVAWVAPFRVEIDASEAP